MPRKKENADQRFNKKTNTAAKALSKSVVQKGLSKSNRRKKRSERYGKILEEALKKTSPDLDFLLIGAAYLLALSRSVISDVAYNLWFKLAAGSYGIKNKLSKEKSAAEARTAFLPAIDYVVRQRLVHGGGAWELFRKENLTPFECSVVLSSFSLYFLWGCYELTLICCLKMSLPGSQCLKEAMRSFSEEKPLLSKKLIKFKKGRKGRGQNINIIVSLTKECEEKMLALVDPAIIKPITKDDRTDMFKQDKEQKPKVPSRKIEDLVLPDDMWWEVKEAIQASIQAREEKQEPLRLPPVFLFSGPPGTGKTFAAEVIAGSLAMPLYTVPMTSILHKYVGESPKAVEAAFAEAQKAKAVLFFDEADSFLWSREFSIQGHESNLVNSFLHFIDIREVPVIFATNMKYKLDPAFFRRIDVMVEFPFPDECARGNIWKSVLSQFKWGAKVDLDEVRKIQITGGLMHNAARSVDRKLLTGRITAESLNKSLVEEARKQTAKMVEARRTTPLRIRGFECE